MKCALLGHVLLTTLAACGVACSTSSAQRTVLPEGSSPDAAPPRLTALSVEGTGAAAAVTLIPAFSSDIHDYYVRCAAGVNALKVSMTASSGATSLVSAPTKSASAASQTVSMNVNEGQAIVAEAVSGAATTEYWVRCLPHDFTTMTFTKHPDAGTAPPGYYLIGTKQNTAFASYAAILDSNGVPVWYMADAITLKNDLQDVGTVVPGAISFFAAVDRPYEIHFLDPPSTKYMGEANANIDVHEMRYLPENRHFLILNHPVTPGVDLTGLTIPTATGGTQALGPDMNIQDCQISEYDYDGKQVWQWLGTDYLEPRLDVVAAGPGQNQPVAPNGGQVIDAFHCNSIDVDPANGNLLVSARDMDTVFYIDKASKEILWKMGGSRYTKHGARYIAVPDAFHGQHDARFQPSWSAAKGTGQISVFDDEKDSAGPMRGVVYDVEVGSLDGGNGADGGIEGVAKVAWQYSKPSISDSMGSFRILPDGSRIIGWGLPGIPDLTFTEVDVAGHDLIDFYLSPGVVTYRSLKVPLSALDLNLLRRTCGAPQ